MVRREIAPTSQALQVAFSRLFRVPMLSESTSFGSRWGIYEMSSRDLLDVASEDGLVLFGGHSVCPLLPIDPTRPSYRRSCMRRITQREYSESIHRSA